MAHVSPVKSGVTVDDDRRAHHLLTRSRLTNNQIKHVCGFVFDHDAPSLNVKKAEEAAMSARMDTFTRGALPRSIVFFFF